MFIPARKPLKKTSKSRILAPDGVWGNTPSSSNYDTRSEVCLSQTSFLNQGAPWKSPHLLQSNVVVQSTSIRKALIVQQPCPALAQRDEGARSRVFNSPLWSSVRTWHKRELFLCSLTCVACRCLWHRTDHVREHPVRVRCASS